MKKFFRLVFATILVGAVFEVVSPTPVALAATNKITICHRTHATNNPYRRITVNKSSVTNANGHSNKSHDEYSTVLFPGGKPQPNVYSAAVSYTPATEKLWGDIIPTFLTDGSDYTGTDNGLNFTRTEVTNNNFVNLPAENAGKDIYYNRGSYVGYCKGRTAYKFCTDEIAAGRTLGECTTDLEEQESNDDAAEKKACGGTFIGCSLETMKTISVTATSASCVSSSSYSLSGAMSLGTQEGKAVFEYTKDSTFNTYSSSDLSYAKTGNTTYKVTVTGITAGTWNYRLVVITGSGDTEGRIESDPLTFSATGAACVAVTGTTVPGQTTPTVTTIPTKSTLPPGTSFTPGKGGLDCRVWIDSNRNGAKDDNEPYLPGISVTITKGSSSFTKTTDESGYCLFIDLEPGEWTVVATLSIESLEKVFDSDGTPEWTTAKTVVEGEIASTSFAAAGTASLKVTNVLKLKSLAARWAGSDAKFCTADDTVFKAPVKKQTATFAGVPDGKYQVSATGVCKSGVVFASPTAMTGEIVIVDLPELVKTGISLTVWLSVLAFGLVLTGSFMRQRSRRTTV